MILNAHEKMIAKRYLVPVKGERFIFVVAGFSIGAVALGVAALIIVWRHRENIARMVSGTEHRLGARTRLAYAARPTRAPCRRRHTRHSSRRAIS